MTDFVEQLEEALENEPVPGTRFCLLYPEGGSRSFNWDGGSKLVEQLFDDSLRYYVKDIYTKTESEWWDNGISDVETYMVCLEECQDGQTNITPELLDAMRKILEYWK